MGMTLMANTSLQLMYSTSTPPSSGPATKAVPVQAVHVPMAFALPGPLKMEVIMANELGTRSAAPAP